MERVVIVGAGYGGLRLFKQLAERGEFEVVLFDKHPYHYLQTDVYRYIANENRFTDITVDLHTLECAYDGKAIFYKETVTGVDFEHKRIITEQRRLSYDYLVIATGAVTNFSLPIKGLRDHCYDLKSVAGAMRFKQAFESAMLERIEMEGERCAFSIVIIGAGLSGVEIAAEMAHFAAALYKKNHFLCDHIAITLVSSTPQLLPGNDPYLGNVSMQRLKQLGIRVITRRRVSEVEADRVVLDDGTLLDSTFTLFAGGIAPGPLCQSLTAPKDARGFIRVDATLRIVGEETAFAMGDCANIPGHDDRPLPATADLAESTADLIAKNLQLHAKKMPLRAHTLKSRGTIVALGGRYSAAKIGNIRFRGFLAFIMKWVVEYLYLLRLRRVCKTGTQLICKNRQDGDSPLS